MSALGRTEDWQILLGMIGAGVGGVASTLLFHQTPWNSKTVEIGAQGWVRGIAYTVINILALTLWEATAQDMCERVNKKYPPPSLQQRYTKTVVFAGIAGLTALLLEEDMGTPFEAFTCWVVANTTAYLLARNAPQ